MLSALASFIQVYLLFTTITIHSGMSTQFSRYDSFNPNPKLACTGEVINDKSLVVAHRTLPCGTIVRVCNKDITKCIDARVLDRGPYGCKKKKDDLCEEYRSELDLSFAVGKSINHSGFEEIIFLSKEDKTWVRKSVKKKKPNTS